jgi:hypothetical protein
MTTFLRNPRLLTSLVCALFLSGALNAEVSSTEPREKQREEHVAVGSRPMDPEKIKRIEEQALQSAYSSDDETQTPPTSELQTAVKKTKYKVESEPEFRLASARVMASPLFSLVNFPISCHWLTSRSPDFRHVQIEDGSTWEITASDYSTINSWRTDDPLFITPNNSWFGFSSYRYYISNRVTNTYVKANLVDGPVAFGPYSNWVTGIDFVQKQVFLQNQTVWTIDPQDMYILADRRNNTEWAPNDHIIVILHDNRYSPYDHILINVNMNNQVRARAY